MKIEVGKAYRCPVGLAGVPTKDGEVVVVKGFKSDLTGLEVELEGDRKMTIMLSMFRPPYFEPYK